jgi:plastocyanin
VSFNNEAKNDDGEDMTHSKVRLTLASACLLVLAATACSSDEKTAVDGSAAPAAPAGLTISGNTFGAASVTAGTAFSIVNDDSVGHTVTDDAGSFDQAVGGGASAPLTIPTAGTYAIHCKIHASMHGTITVA